MSPVLVILALVCVGLSISMLVARNPITSALCLLGILIMTAGIYGLIGEHLIATIQLVVYAGAIMVLFVFSIMLLNLNKEDHEFKQIPGTFYGAIVVGLIIFSALTMAIKNHFDHHHASRAMGQFTPQVIQELGGNSRVLSHALFTQYYVSFEVISLALLVAVVGAVVLAKRKFD